MNKESVKGLVKRGRAALGAIYEVGASSVAFIADDLAFSSGLSDKRPEEPVSLREAYFGRFSTSLAGVSISPNLE